MRNVAREHEKARLEPPMAPMIDIVFQLLIFFMLTQQWESEAYLTTNLPRTQGPNRATQTDVPRIKISLFDEEPDGAGVTVELNETQAIGSTAGMQFRTEAERQNYEFALFDKLEGELGALRTRGLPDDHPVLISPTPAVMHKFVVGAFDAAVGAKFKNIQFAVPQYMASPAGG